MRQSRIRAVIEASVVIFVGALTLSTFGCAGRDDPPPAGDGGMRSPAGDGGMRGTWTSMFVDDDGISCLGCAGITVAVTGTRTP